MLSDEEKKAIERLEDLLKQRNENKIQINTYDLFGTIEIVLNLIKKQSKEIEELKEKNRQSKMRIVQLENEITARIEDVNQYYTSNDKIKTKIEELEIEQESNREDLKIAIDNLSLQNIDKIANKISINMSIRGILQSLLEKE